MERRGKSFGRQPAELTLCMWCLTGPPGGQIGPITIRNKRGKRLLKITSYFVDLGKPRPRLGWSLVKGAVNNLLSPSREYLSGDRGTSLKIELSYNFQLAFSPLFFCYNTWPAFA